MIDLSHLTEEEKGMIMMVLKRDEDLKRAEEERIGKLQKVLSRASNSETPKLKYLTGEWFYEAKSYRHMDKIHGSEIILASMKQKTAGHLDGSLRLERPRVSSERGPNITSPPKPAKRLEITQLHDKSVSDAENEKLNLAVCSPGRPRHNPFNRASLIMVDSPENTETPPTNGNTDTTSRTEAKSLQNYNAAGKAGQTSGAAVSSEGSSIGVRPVPKKRTFLSRRFNTQSESDSSGHGSQAGSKIVVPAPRVSLQQGSSGGSNQSSLRATGEPSKKTATSHQESPSSQPLCYANQVFIQPLCDVPQVSPNTGLDREDSVPSLQKDRTATINDNPTDGVIPDKSVEIENSYGEVNLASLSTARMKDPEINNISSELTVFNQGNHSLTQGIVDQPVRYDLNLIVKHDPKKSNQKLVSTLCLQETPNPSGEEEQSIAKVLDWFNRSMDSDDWLDTDDSKQDIINTDKQGRIRIESLTKDVKDAYDNRIRTNKMEPAEIDLYHSQKEANQTKNDKEQSMLRTDRMEKKEVSVAQGVRNTRAQEKVQEVKANEDVNQPPKISNLKSLWEKGNGGSKILISGANVVSDKGRMPPQLSMEKEREKHITDNKPHNIEMPSVKGKCDNYTSNPKDEKAKIHLAPVYQYADMDSIENVKLVVHSNQQADYTPKKGTTHTAAPKMHASPTYLGKRQSPLTPKKEDQKYNADYLLQANSQIDRRGSDTETEISRTKNSSQPGAPVQSSLNPEYERFSSLRSSTPPESLFQYRDLRSSPSIVMVQQEQLLRACPNPQLEANLQAVAGPDYAILSQSRSSPYMDYQSGGNDAQFTPKTQTQRGSIEDVMKKANEDRSAQASMSSKKQEESTNKDRSNSPYSQKHQETTAERIKQLKSFWEKERNMPFYADKSKAFGDGKSSRGSNLVKLNKRFTKSEYDLKSIGNDSDSDVEDTDGNGHNFTVVAMNQRQDKSSPSLGTNRAQFNNLREFWGEASNRRGPPSFDTPKSQKRKDQMDSQPSAMDLKPCIDTEFDQKNAVSVEKSSVRPTAMKSSPPSQNRSKSTSDRQTGPGSATGNDKKNNFSYYAPVESGQQRDSRRGSKDSTREDKYSKIQSSVGKESRSLKKKDSSSSGRANSLRRTTSMFSLNVTEEQDSDPFVGQHKKSLEASPVQFQSRRPSADRTQARRQSADKGITARRASEDSDTLAPRARAFVPRDYRHYLGMTEKTSVHTSLAPAVKEQGSEGKSGFDLDLSGPVRASTPVGSEERYGRRGSKTSQRPLWVNYSSSETGRESSVSSTSETWSNSRNSSSRENEKEDPNPVRRALRRAEVRPKNLAKSLEDITASITPRQERRLDASADLRRSSDVPSIDSPSSSSFSDPEHLKKMSKSVPSFLQKEAHGKDSTSEDIYHGGRLKMSRSNHNNPAGKLSGSVMTVYSGDFGNVEVQGNIQFSINYVQKLREFHIFVAQCRDLAAVDPKRGRSDPYVKSYLVPDKAHLGKRKTSVKKKTLNPTFNEILRYRIRMEYLRTQTLILSVWHHDTFGKNSFLGEVDVDLSKWDFDHTQMNYLALKARTTPNVLPSDDRGEMRVAIRFLPQIRHTAGTAKEGPNSGEVHIWVKDCKNLPLIRATIDPYVKCFVLPDTSRKGRQKTRVLQRTVDPAFNHTMVYDGIRQEDLTEACIELTVWDRDRLASNLLGGLRLGPGTGRSYGVVVDWMDSTPFEVALWERMMYSPNEWVEEVLPLRILTSAKTALK